MVSHILETTGEYTVCTANNGEEAYSEATKRNYDMIITDINMPKMDGHEFLKKMRGDPKLNNIPVFILTTSKAPKDLGDAYDMAVIGYVIKEELSESLEKALTVLEQTWRFE